MADPVDRFNKWVRDPADDKANHKMIVTFALRIKETDDYNSIYEWTKDQIEDMRNWLIEKWEHEDPKEKAKADKTPSQWRGFVYRWFRRHKDDTPEGFKRPHQGYLTPSEERDHYLNKRKKTDFVRVGEMEGLLEKAKEKSQQLTTGGDDGN